MENVLQSISSDTIRYQSEFEYYYLNKRQILTAFVPDEVVEPLVGKSNWLKAFYLTLDKHIKKHNLSSIEPSILKIKVNEYGTVLDFDVDNCPYRDLKSIILKSFSDHMPQFTPVKLNREPIDCIIHIAVYTM